MDRVTIDAFVVELVSGRREACRARIDALLASGVSLRAVYVDLIQAALYEVGLRWERGEVSVSAEHIATSVVEELLAHLFPHAVHRPSIGRRALVSCAADEFHQVGGRIVADSLEAAGWDVDFVGANVSVEQLAQRVARVRLDLVALSVSIQGHLPKLEASVRAVRGVAPTVPIVVGGRGLLDDGDAFVRALGLPGVHHVGSLDALDDFLMRGAS